MCRRFGCACGCGNALESSSCGSLSSSLVVVMSNVILSSASFVEAFSCRGESLR